MTKPTERDIGWAAAFIDGEGCILFAGASRQPRVAANNTDIWMLRKLRRIVGVGTIRRVKPCKSRLGKKPMFNWAVQSIDGAKSVVRLIYEDLSPRRKKQARAVIARVKIKGGVRKFQFGDRCRRGHLLTKDTTYKAPHNKLVCSKCKRASVARFNKNRVRQARLDRSLGCRKG